MASRANSTGAPVEQPPSFEAPPSPLPETASRAWVALWRSVCLTHPQAPQAIAAAYAVGVDPESFCALTLHSHDPHVDLTMPHLWFGASYLDDCRVIGAHGEVRS